MITSSRRPSVQEPQAAEYQGVPLKEQGAPFH